jgi:hypothetical protein
MNIIEVMKISNNKDKLRRKEWGETGSRGASILFLYKNGEKYTPIYYQGTQPCFRLSTFLITEDYIADDWEVVE